MANHLQSALFRPSAGQRAERSFKAVATLVATSVPLRRYLKHPGKAAGLVSMR
jgi:hypothetical protein